MTPEEKRVVEAAIAWFQFSGPQELVDAVKALEASRWHLEHSGQPAPPDDGLSQYESQPEWWDSAEMHDKLGPPKCPSDMQIQFSARRDLDLRRELRALRAKVVGISNARLVPVRYLR